MPRVSSVEFNPGLRHGRVSASGGTASRNSVCRHSVSQGLAPPGVNAFSLQHLLLSSATNGSSVNDSCEGRIENPPITLIRFVPAMLTAFTKKTNTLAHVLQFGAITPPKKMCNIVQPLTFLWPNFWQCNPLFSACSLDPIPHPMVLYC